MKDLYQKILNKPEIYRQRLAYGITAFFGVIIFTIWLSQTMIAMRETFQASEENNAMMEEIKEGMPSLQTEEMNLPENLFSEEFLLMENEETSESETIPASTNENNSLNMKGSEMETPKEESSDMTLKKDENTTETKNSDQ